VVVVMSDNQPYKRERVRESEKKNEKEKEKAKEIRKTKKKKEIMIKMIKGLGSGTN
jgi:hypothetical protein